MAPAAVSTGEESPPAAGGDTSATSVLPESRENLSNQDASSSLLPASPAVSSADSSPPSPAPVPAEVSVPQQPMRSSEERPSGSLAHASPPDAVSSLASSSPLPLSSSPSTNPQVSSLPSSSPLDQAASPADSQTSVHPHFLPETSFSLGGSEASGISEPAEKANVTLHVGNRTGPSRSPLASSLPSLGSPPPSPSPVSPAPPSAPPPAFSPPSSFPLRRLTKRGEAVKAWVHVWAQLGEIAMFSKEIERAKRQAVESRKRLASDTKNLPGVLHGLETDAAAALSSAAAAQQAALVDEEHQNLIFSRLQKAEALLREESKRREEVEEENCRLQEAFGRQSAQIREELEEENCLLRQQILDLEEEFKTLTNQAVTVRRLEEEQEQQKRSFEQRLLLAVQEKEKSLRAQIGAKDEEQARLVSFLKQTAQNLEERNLMLESRLAEGQQQLLQLKTDSEKRCAALAAEVTLLNAQLEQVQREERTVPFPASTATQQSATQLRALEVAQQRITALQQEERRLLDQLDKAEKEKEQRESVWKAEREREAQAQAQEVAELQRALRERPTEEEVLLLRGRVHELESRPGGDRPLARSHDAGQALAEARLLRRIEELETLMRKREAEHQDREDELKRRVEDERKQHRDVVRALQGQVEAETERSSEGLGENGPSAEEPGAQGSHVLLGLQSLSREKEEDRTAENGEKEERKLPSMLQVVLKQREQSRARVAALEEELEAAKAQLVLQQQELYRFKSEAAETRLLSQPREACAPQTRMQAIPHSSFFPAAPCLGSSPSAAAPGALVPASAIEEERSRVKGERGTGASRKRRPGRREERQGFVAGLLAVAHGVAQATSQTAASVWGDKGRAERRGKSRASLSGKPDAWAKGFVPENDEEAGLGGGLSSEEVSRSDWGTASGSSSDEENIEAGASREGDWRGLAAAGPRRREEGRRKHRADAERSSSSSLARLPAVCAADRRFASLKGGEEKAFLSRLQNLSGAERIVVIWGRLLLSRRATRLFALFYFLLLHFLVFLVLFYHADLQSRGHADQAGSQQPRYHYYLNE
ncbi:conserved hypothetical protein [Neospora caninum Liverpool]|uniref:CASP C-terminal domain-containing protein n=1 Tax=Neospora caninum (strain Liverpool) TaxID=572307 RepID=F0VRD9_NEOCL|nr:conserved hypothetical protein [Neospora caninum Liverpool]CBZ56287.1 conserved hypothetical protein [Neospora caninum Liverpool]|eukprot:XP_003886312.1 conserved hypothetical protein [Neospora caninum Liverpool]